MNFNNDGFNERTNYIHNCNDLNRLKKKGTFNFDNSFVQMKIEENKPNIKTANNYKVFVNEKVIKNEENFKFIVPNIRTYMTNNNDNSVSRALNRNMFKK